MHNRKYTLRTHTHIYTNTQTPHMHAHTPRAHVQILMYFVVNDFVLDPACSDLRTCPYPRFYISEALTPATLEMISPQGRQPLQVTVPPRNRQALKVTFITPMVNGTGYQNLMLVMGNETGASHFCTFGTKLFSTSTRTHRAHIPAHRYVVLQFCTLRLSC
jgi:hypothetical protein